MIGDINDEKITNYLDNEMQQLESLIKLEFLKSGRNSQLFNKEVKAFLELIKLVVSSHVFQKIPDVKFRLMMEEIQLHYLFLQFIDSENFDQITKKIWDIIKHLNVLIDPNYVYKRKPVILLLF